MNKSLGWVKILYILMAVLYIIAGITFFVNPITSEVVLGTFIGAMMVVYGIMMVVAYFTASNFKSVWALLLGIALIVLGLVVWTNLFDSMNVIGVFVGIAFLFSGAYKTYASFQFKDLGLPGWVWILITGIATLIVGGIMVFNPSVSGGYFTILVGASFLTDGIADLILGLTAF
ncbi:MAG: DUF308 domain-containing protein [Ileibacterium sp.]|nr:DUF308 domain-containing protein [Ileibacterium sp.]